MVGESNSGEITHIVFVSQLKENVDSVDSDLVIADMVDDVIIMTYDYGIPPARMKKEST